MKRETGILWLLLGAALLASCGGGGGGSSSTSYTGLMTPAVITDNNADEIALEAYRGGDLGASTGIILAPSGAEAVPAVAARPAAFALVQALKTVAVPAVRPSVATDGPSLLAPEVIDDGQGGYASYTLNVNEQTGSFTGTFTFTNFHGDGGGVMNGSVGVSGSITETVFHLLFHFQSVQIVDVAAGASVHAAGTVDLTIDTTQLIDSGAATLNLVFTDDFTQKMVWLSNYQIVTTVGDGYSDVAISGRIYLHDYGYVNVVTSLPFRYLDGATNPESGQMTVTGDQGKSVRLTADSETQVTLELYSDANGPPDWIVTVNWNGEPVTP